MLWQRCITVLLSFATSINAHSTSIPRISDLKAPDDENDKLNDRAVYRLELESLPAQAFMLPEIVTKCLSHLGRKDLEQANIVCKKWQELADEEFQRRADTKIVRLGPDNEFSETDFQLLRNAGEKNHLSNWRPELVLLFQVDWMLDENQQVCDLIRKLPTTDVKCFAVESPEECNDFSLRYGTPAECLSKDCDKICDGCILSEGFRRKFDVDVIFPSLDMFRPGLSLFRGQPKANKELFADRFGWRKEAPIKLAFIFIRQTYDGVPAGRSADSDDTVRYRSHEITRWLRSLPEGEGIFIHTIRAQKIHRKTVRPATGNGKDIAVLLFGGDAMYIDSVTYHHKKCRDGEESFEELTSNFESLRDSVERVQITGGCILVWFPLNSNDWCCAKSHRTLENDRVSEWSEDTQRIYFVLNNHNRNDVAHKFWEVIGDYFPSYEYNLLPGTVWYWDCANITDVSRIIFVGFPE